LEEVNRWDLEDIWKAANIIEMKNDHNEAWSNYMKKKLEGLGEK
jgi:hypothetical protein